MKGLVFTYLLTYGGAAASLFNPFIGLLVYVCFAIIKPEAMWHWSVPAGNYSRIVALALLAGWAARGFGSWQLGRAWGITAAFVGLLIWTAVSATQAGQAELAWKLVEQLAKFVLPFLVGITTIDSVRKLKQLAWVIMLSQGYVAFEINLSYLGGFNQVAEYGFCGMDNNSVAIAMNSCIGLAFFLGLYAERWWQKLIALGAALLMAHAILLTFSRGGMLGLLTTGVVSFLLLPKRPIYFAILAGASVAVFQLAGPEVRARFSSSFQEKEKLDSSAAGRIDLWADCWDCAVRNPLLGVGPNNWGEVAPRYGWPLGKEGHSTWLQAAAELGLPGMLMLATFYGLCLVRMAPNLRGSAGSTELWLCHLTRMVIASLIGFAVSAQFVSLICLEIPYYVTLIGAGVLKLSSLPGEQPPTADPVPRDEQPTAP
jgi:probable O-glycosylation ligase (exosortase A-associated)